MGNPVVHFEIGCRDLAQTTDFYTRLFDWKLETAGPATNIDTGEGGISGHFTSLGHEPHHYVTVYVRVDHLETCLEKVKEFGGKVLIPPIPLPDGRRFAWIADPEGNLIGLLQPA
jgi:predicted enzyme related to lactoylglutathione lyase